MTQLSQSAQQITCAALDSTDPPTANQPVISPSSSVAAPPTWFRWRYIAYFLFVLLRVALHARDQNFPVHDGAYYVEKAAWMAAAPLPRAFSVEAFAHTPIRPPGPMWMLLPFLLLSNTLVSYIIGMSFWLVAFIEAALRGACRPGGRLRDWAALSLLAGTGALLCLRSFYLVDGLFAVQAAAAAGVAAAWLQDQKRRHALLIGLVLAAALLTKPAGLYLIAVTALSLAPAHLLIWRAEKTSFRQTLLLPSRTLLLWTGVPVAIALAALLLTPYREVLNFPDVMKVPGFGNWGLGTPLSPESFLRSAQFLLCNLGAVPAAAALAIGTVLSVKLLLARPPIRLTVAALLPLAMAFLFVVCIAATPVIQPRYLAPAALMLLVWLAAAASALEAQFTPVNAASIAGPPDARSSRITRLPAASLAAFALLAVTQQFLAFKHKLPYISAVPPCYSVEDRQQSEKTLFHAFTAALTADNPPDPLLFSTDLLDHATPFHTSLLFADSGLSEISLMLQTPRKFRLRTAEFPQALLTSPFSEDFLNADYLVASRPEVMHPMPPGSESADWQWINDRLWDAGTAASLSWSEIARSADGVLYEWIPGPTDAAGFEMPASVRRAAWLRQADLNSSDSAELKRHLPPFPALTGTSPPRRAFHYRLSARRTWEFLLHPEWPDNRYPMSARLLLTPGDTVTARVPAEQSDGVQVRVSVQDKVSTAPRLLTEQPVTPATPARFALRDLLSSDQQTSIPKQILFTVTPGRAGDFQYDAVWFRLERP